MKTRRLRRRNQWKRYWITPLRQFKAWINDMGQIETEYI